MSRVGRKQKHHADTGNGSEPEPELADGIDTCASVAPLPTKKKKKPDEKDVEWLEAHEYLDLTDEKICGMFLATVFKIFIHSYPDKQSKGWGASCYNHFSLPPAIVEIGGLKKYWFYCKWHVLLIFYGQLC